MNLNPGAQGTSLRKTVQPFVGPVLWRSAVQIVNTLVPLALLYATLGLLYLSGLWWLLPPAILVAGAFMVRTFILFHDCTHMAFFKSAKANVAWGHLFGILSFTPYASWRHEHNKHHGTVGNLDKRGVGDVWTMTVSEYLAAGRFKRFVYRIYRNPVFLFFIAPVFLFGLLNRFPSARTKGGDHWSLLITNAGIGLMAIGGSLWLGLWGYLFLQVATLYVAGVLGVWLFFVQHQFDEVYWEGNETWEFTRAALAGSSFYKLPRALDWISGSIGYHHIHHLNPQIPNYNLRRCHQVLMGTATVDIAPPYTVTLLQSFRLALLHLYDEANGRLISFRMLHRRLQAPLS